MITIIGRKLVIPDCDRVLGASGDSGTKIRVRLSEETVKRYFPDGATVDNVGITLIMEYKENKSAFPSVALHYAKDGVHEGYVTIAETRTPGLLVARALLTYAHGDSNVAMQTEEDYFLVSDDIDASDVTDTGNTYTAWNAVLKDIKDASADAVEAKDKAEEYAKTASGVTENIKAFNEAYGDFSKQAEKAKEHYDSRSNPHEVIASQVGAYSKHEVDLQVGSVAMLVDNVDSRLNNHEINHQNPHKVTAEQVGSYDKAYIDVFFESVFTELRGHKTDDGNPHKVTANQVGAYGIEETYSREEVFNKDEISLMFEEHGGADVEVDELLDVNSSNPVANKVLYAKFASIDGKIGDIDTALDAILDIQANLTGMADVELPGGEDE